MHRRFLLPAIALLVVVEVEAQSIRGRILDEGSRRPLVETAVTLRDRGGAALVTVGSDRDGFFELRAPAPGAYSIVAERIGYAAALTPVTVGGEGLTVAAILMRPTAVVLDSIAGGSRPERRAAAVGFSRGSHVVSGERMAHFERQGTRVQNILRGIAGLRVRNLGFFTARGGQRMADYVCIESPRRLMNLQSRSLCEPVVLVIDDITVGDPHAGTRSFSVADIESIEFVPPADAGTRYGMDAGAFGALVIWTRGRGPHRHAGRDGGG